MTDFPAVVFLNIFLGCILPSFVWRSIIFSVVNKAHLLVGIYTYIHGDFQWNLQFINIYKYIQNKQWDEAAFNNLNMQKKKKFSQHV